MHIALIVKPGHPDTGVGRYAACLQMALENLGHQVSVVHPINPLPGWIRRLFRRWLRMDVEEFFNTYPLLAHYPKADIYHLTSQNLATLMYFCRPPGKVVVTVHDIIPWLTRKDPDLRVYRHFLEAWIDLLALRSLRRADAILADSEFTRQSLLAQKGMENLQITTVRLGVD